MSDVDNMRIAEMPSLRKTPSLQSPTSSVSAKPKTIAGIKPENDFDMPFSETYNLTRLSPEEAAVRLKKFEEERKNWEKQENPIQTETDRAFKHPNPLPAEAHEDNILKRIQNIITKNGRFDYLSLHDVPISQCFFNKIDELGCKKDKENRHYCTDPTVVLRIVKAVHTINETKGKKLLSKIIEAG